jgi:hypothetical protein
VLECQSPHQPFSLVSIDFFAFEVCTSWSSGAVLPVTAMEQASQVKKVESKFLPRRRSASGVFCSPLNAEIDQLQPPPRVVSFALSPSYQFLLMACNGLGTVNRTRALVLSLCDVITIRVYEKVRGYGC